MGALTWTWQQTLGLALGTGIVGLLTLGVRSILTGRLVPRSVLMREQQISDQWRTAHDTQAQASARIAEMLQQVITAQGQLAATVERLVISVDRMHTANGRHGGRG